MHFLIAPLIFAGSLLLVLYSYVNYLYSEKGRFLIRGSRGNVDLFEEQVEPKLAIGLDRAEMAFPLLVQMDLILLVLLTASWSLWRPLSWDALLQAAVFLVLDVLFCAQVIPGILVARTRGRWLLSCVGILRVSILLVSPLVAISRVLRHVASLGKEEEPEPASPSENIEALMTAGEEEGLLEKEDRRLIRSVVEFGDKTVREVMTPRPEIFAIPAETTVGELKQTLAKRRFTRIPVYEGDLDQIRGFVHALDLFSLSDAEFSQQRVEKFLRPLLFVPETKPISELLREIQQKAQMAIVVDEYGLVAGLVTVEDIVEEIVGEIRDEHEALDVMPQGEGAFSVPGNMDLDRLQELFGVRLEDSGDATTVSGLLTGTLGRVPVTGEVLHKDGLTFRVTESNGRRVLRLVITGPVEKPSGVFSSSETIPSNSHPSQPQ